MVKKPNKKEWVKFGMENMDALLDRVRELDRNNELAERLYTHGMAVADCLRLLGRHEEAHQVEVWVLNNVRSVQNG
jgi:hypothetical protein